MFALLDLYEQLKSDAPENFLIQIDEYPENSSFLIDFAAKETAGKTNVDVLNSYYNKYNRSKLTEQHVGQTVETEIIPGLSVVTYMDSWDDIDNKPWDVTHAFSVSHEVSGSKKNVVKMPQNYLLNNMYKGGILGNDVELEDLDANTNISGGIYGSQNFSSVYNLFVENQAVSELPNINISLSFDSKDAGNHNVYGYNIDKIIEKYYTNNKGNKLSVSLPSSSIFDARAYLNGNMYSGNTYQNNAYPLDINAALVMNPEHIKNVKITGTKNVNKNTLKYLTNVYVSSNMNGISISEVLGVAEFNGEAPAQIYGDNSYIVFKKVSNHVEVGGNLGYVDITSLFATEASKISSDSNYYYVKGYAAKSGVALPGVGQTPVTNVNDLAVTKEQVERNTVDGKNLEDPISKVLPRDIKASKMDLMRNILEDNQSTLLSFSGLTRESIA